MNKSTQYLDSKIISRYLPLNFLTPSETQLLAQKLHVLSVQPGTTLSDINAHKNHAIYLLNGKVKIESGDGKSQLVHSESERALQPINFLPPHFFKVTSITAVDYFSVDKFIVDNLAGRHEGTDTQTEIAQRENNLLNNKLYQAIIGDLQNDNLILPPLPEVVMRVRAISDERDSVSRLKSIIQTDPAMTAMVMKVANCAIYRGYSAVKTLDQAIVRMGLTPTKNYIVSYAMRDIFKTRSPYIRRRMLSVWHHSTEVAATAYILAGKLNKFDAEYAMLLGLLHDIGMIPILTYAEKHARLVVDNDVLDDTIKQLHGELGSLMFSKWKFAPEYVKVAAESDDWYRDSEAEADYCDLILVAQLHSFLGKSTGTDVVPEDHKSLPELVDLPAFRKLGLTTNQLDSGLVILQDARREIDTIVNVLRAA